MSDTIQENKLKVVLVIFGNVSSKGQSGLSLFHYKLAEYFHAQRTLKSIYCLDYDKHISFSDVTIHSLLHNSLYKLLFKIIQGLYSFAPFFSLRLVKEWIFDTAYSKEILKDDVNVLICTKPVVPAIINEAIKGDVKTIVIATVAHPIFIRSVIERVEQMYNVKDKSSYSNSKRIERLVNVYKRTDSIVPRIPSDFVHNSYINNGIPSDKLLQLDRDTRFILDYEIYQPNFNSTEALDKIVYITAGFMNLKKGLPILIQVWNELFSEGLIENAELHIVGSLDIMTGVVLKRMHLAPSIILKGHQANVHTFYQDADVFIASSVSDLGPRTVQEAMACGLPVIATTNCGTAEFITEGKSGFTYDAFDMDELKKHILWFYHNRSQCRIMGQEASESLKRVKTINFSEQVYKECLRLLNKP